MAGVAYLVLPEVMNYLYITRFLWQFLTGVPLTSPLLPSGGN